MYVVVLITTKNVKEANKIANKLVQEKLIACANVIKDVRSIFRWEGKVDKANETLLILKTKKGSVSKIINRVKTLHSYSVPEIIALPVIGGNKDYLKWVEEST